MKAPSMAPAYLGLYTLLCETAREHGYALAVHGTMQRDLDLVAIPWIEEAADAVTLATAIARRCDLALGLIQGDGTPLWEPARRPHGRLAWSIPLRHGDEAVVDLSVMPRQGGTT